MIADLGPILDHVPAWLLVLFRIGGILFFAPFFGSLNVPGQVKVLLVVALSFCIYPLLLDPGRAAAASVGAVIDDGLAFWSLATMIALELLVGYAIGFAASLPLLGMQMSGEIIEIQLGIRMGGFYNPDTGAESGPLSELLYAFALATFIILGGHHIVLVTLAGSFDAIPLGGFHAFGDLVNLMLGLVTVIFELAIRITTPLVCLMMFEIVAMNFVARTVPGLNILSIGFPVKILVGIAFLAVSFTILFNVYVDVARQILHRVLEFFTL